MALVAWLCFLTIVLKLCWNVLEDHTVLQLPKNENENKNSILFIIRFSKHESTCLLTFFKLHQTILNSQILCLPGHKHPPLIYLVEPTCEAHWEPIGYVQFSPWVCSESGRFTGTECRISYHLLYITLDIKPSPKRLSVLEIHFQSFSNMKEVTLNHCTPHSVVMIFKSGSKGN